MKPMYFDFLKKLLIFTFILIVFGFSIAYLLPEKYVTPTLPFLFAFFLSVTIIVHYILLKVSEKKTPAFINYFMLLTFGKLIFYLTIILIYAFVNREDLLPFTITFFILYIFFTGFEVVVSLKLTKLNKKNNSIENRNIAFFLYLSNGKD